MRLALVFLALLLFAQALAGDAPDPDELERVLEAAREKQREKAAQEEALKEKHPGLRYQGMHFGGQAAGIKRLLQELERKKRALSSKEGL